MSGSRPWPRPVPTVGDTSSAAQRAAAPGAWAFDAPAQRALEQVIAARRDIRRFRPDPVPADKLRRILQAAHEAPSVGHSQPWRFVVVTEPGTRAEAALLADRARIAQAAAMDPASGRHLLDLDLEGIREAPLGIVVCCDRRAPAAGVLGRATFTDADMWSCACAIENLWLTARAEGLGVGWVTLFEPAELAALVNAPAGVETLGWLCVGWPDERPPSPGLERRGWSRRADPAGVVIQERWPADGPEPPRSHLAPPDQKAVVAARDLGDELLTPPGSLGILDTAVDRLLSLRPSGIDGGVLILAAADHPVAAHGVSAFEPGITRVVAEASVAGVSLGAVAAAGAGLLLQVVDAGVDGSPLEGAVHLRPAGPKGDLVSSDALTEDDVIALIDGGARLAAGHSLIALGEIGVANTTASSALAAALLGCDPLQLIGLGAGADSAMVAKKAAVVTEAVRRAGGGDPRTLLARLGGGELAVLTGVVLGAARAGAVVVLDGMATSVSALAAVMIEPAAAAHLIAGQRSREPGHAPILAALGLEPLLDLRLRAGEGVGAAMSVTLLRAALAMRQDSARTAPFPPAQAPNERPPSFCP
jgi:nicotinate-nucleotide--dimethylbenzimidazole phosphoribosyltransferase